jgi:hypothetical protein
MQSRKVETTVDEAWVEFLVGLAAIKSKKLEAMRKS